MENKITYRVTEADTGKRADKLFADALSMSRNQVQRELAEGRFITDKGPVAKGDKLAPGTDVTYTPAPPDDFRLESAEIDLDIVFEDEHLAVVNKPRGMVVHPGAARETDTLAAALLHRYGREGLSQVGEEDRPGIVHRLDKDTSGLLIVAKTDQAHAHLAAQIRDHSFLRRYDAVVHGGFSVDEMTLENQLARSAKDRKKIAVVEYGGKYAKTELRVCEKLGPYTRLQLQLYTGRTHQIRVQLANISHPVCGDALYGPKKAVPGLNGQCLHAGAIGFVHPVTGEDMRFEAPLPPYFIKFLYRLRTDYGGTHTA